MFEKEFHHHISGRQEKVVWANGMEIITSRSFLIGSGPQLEKVRWDDSGKNLIGFEYTIPDDYIRRFITLEKVMVFCNSSKEVHGNILFSNSTKAGIIKIVNSEWKKSFNQSRLADSNHFQIIFNDDIYDLICMNLSIKESNY